MKSVTFCLFVFFCQCCVAETIFTDFSVSLLHGNNYKAGDKTKTVVTFEHTAVATWGSSFLFVDRLKSANGDLETYGEWSPRLLLQSFDEAFIKKIYIASTVEMGTFSSASKSGSAFNNYLLGIGTDLAVPSFKMFQLNLYRRNNELSLNSYHATLAWSKPFANFLYDGFIDYVTKTDEKESSFNFTSQLKVNIGELLTVKNNVYLGVEYVWWRNKYGLDNVNENNVNILLKFHF